MLPDPYKEFAYPEELPNLETYRLDPEIVQLGAGIALSKNWEDLSKIADRLEALGCRDAEVLDHFRNRWVCLTCKGQQRMSYPRSQCYLRPGRGRGEELVEIPCLSCVAGKRHVYSGHKNGCWQGECWLLNQLLGQDQPLRAQWQEKTGGGETVLQSGAAVNPGAWFGKCWMVVVADCMDPPRYVVEADNASDAIDEFIESDWGTAERLDSEDEHHNNDYGFEDTELENGELVRVYRDLRGNTVADKRSEPSVTGQGVVYDGDNIQVSGDDRRGFKCVYIGPGLPEHGVTPEQYANRSNCPACNKVTFPVGLRDDLENFCSTACYDSVYHHPNG